MLASLMSRQRGRNAELATFMVLAVAVASIASVAILYLSLIGSKKVLATAVASVAGLAAIYLAGNLRLFALWGVMATLPLDLSKRFGPQILKMGGESSFRAEISDVFWVILLGYQIWDISRDRIARFWIPPILYRWIILILLGACWAIWGDFRITAAQEVVRMLKLSLMFLVITNELRTRQRFVHAITAMALGVALQGVVGGVQYYTKKHLGLSMLGEMGEIGMDVLAANSVEGLQVFRVSGLLSHPNVFGAFLGALLPMVVGGILLCESWGQRLFFLASFALGLSSLIFTLSRSGWVSFAAGALLLVVLMYRHHGLRRRVVVAISAAALVGGITLIALSGPIIKRIFDSRGDAMRGRDEYKRDAWGMIEARPFLGWGLNSYVMAVPPFTKYGAMGAVLHYKGWIPPVHHIYYLWWSELGIVGLILHLWWLAGCVFIGLRNLKIRDPYLYTLNAACLAGMAAFMVDGFFSFSLRFNSILRVFWVMTAMMAAIRYWRLREIAGLIGAEPITAPPVSDAAENTASSSRWR